MSAGMSSQRAARIFIENDRKSNGMCGRAHTEHRLFDTREPASLPHYWNITLECSAFAYSSRYLPEKSQTITERARHNINLIRERDGKLVVVAARLFYSSPSFARGIIVLKGNSPLGESLRMIFNIIK